MQANYHTHTTRCHHAYGKDEEYVRQAIQNGYDILGFSDHACWKYNTNFRSHIRMDVDDFGGYKASIKRLQKKYENQIEILLGMEAEYFPEYMDWMLDFCIDNDIDYLIFGNHYLGSDEYGPYCGHLPPEKLEDYFRTCIEGMETGMFSYLCHPELIMRNGMEWNDLIEEGFTRVCRKAKELDIPLEYNCLGLQCNLGYHVEEYPHHKFWELAAREGCKAIIGMDAHEPTDLRKILYDYARNYLEGLGIEIAETIPKTDFRALKQKKLQTDK